MIKKFLKKNFFDILFYFSLNIQKISVFEKYILLINKEINLKKKYDLICKFQNEYSNHWLPYYKKLSYYHYKDQKYFIKYIETFHKKNNKFINNNLSFNSDFEIIDTSVYFGSIGNYYALETLIKANKIKIRANKQIIIIIPKNTKVNNSYLFKCFSKYFKIINHDHKDFHIYKNIEKSIHTPLGLILSIKNKSLQMDIASNIIENIIFNKKKSLNILNINKIDKVEGYRILKKNKINIKKWIVTLHVREASFRGENIFNTNERYRSSNPKNYVLACKEIVKAGGIVFRMGDKNMSKFPRVNGVIDYAHSNFRSEFMDIFLASQSKFCVGTSSGYFRIPRYFGRPVLLTNISSYVQLFSLKNKDLFLPRMIKYKENNKFLNFGKCLSPEIGLLWNDNQYNKKKLITIPNTDEEILEATKEMINNVIKKNSYKKDKFQIKFDYIANNKGELYNENKVRNLSTISKFFANKYAKYLIE